MESALVRVVSAEERGQVPFVADPDVLESFRIFLVGEEPPRAELCRALERHAVLPFGRPFALQVGIARR